MNILLLLIPLSLLLVGVAAWAFAWAVRRGQFDDLDTPAIDILREDDDHDPHDRSDIGTRARKRDRPRPGDAD
jgi:cbb3-type cytochrome oxidase maturation protein